MTKKTKMSERILLPEVDRISGMPEFYQLLRVMAELHERKSHDYASDDDPAGNYHFAGEIALMFLDSNDAGFAGRLAEKLYRMSNLQLSSKQPLNENVEDTERDFAVIAALWMADRKKRRTEKKKKELSEKLGRLTLDPTDN